MDLPEAKEAGGMQLVIPSQTSQTGSNHQRLRARRSQNKFWAARFAGCSPLPKQSNPIKGSSEI